MRPSAGSGQDSDDGVPLAWDALGDVAGLLEGVVLEEGHLTRDSLVGFRWLGVSFRWYCGVGGLVVGH